jgi:cellulose synthase/poly-beta-1,6-N-acetylglucosamine synthase-like glycosyltransferase
LGPEPDLAYVSKTLYQTMELKSKLKLSLIITVYNESQTLLDLISALKKQTQPAGEIIIVDGGSTDSTFSDLKSFAAHWPVLKVFQVKGNRSVGRNFGVSKSHFPLLAFTDAGCIPDPDWLLEISKFFHNSSNLVVSGYYRGLPQNNFQRCLVPYVLVMPDRVNPDEFLPSTRSMALRRSLWQKSGGFDPKLNHNEDYAYAIWLKKQKINFVFAPRAIVSWIPRKNLPESAWMFTRFAIGDIQAGIIRPKVKVLVIRYAIFAYLCLLALQLKFLLWVIAAIVLLYFAWSVWKNYRYVNHPSAFFWLPVLQVTADISVLFGSLVGLLAKANGLF